MRNQEEQLCDFVLLYAAGEGTEAERAEFERHLLSCSTCRAELCELSEVWEAMPLLAEEMDAPDDLKTEVLDSIFENDTRNYADTLPRRRKYSGAVLGAASILILALGYAMWIANRGTEEETAVAVISSPSQVLKTYTLNAADGLMPNASGTAWLLEGKERNQVVVHLQGLSKTNGDEAYQVWLIHNGERYNCGTLLVNNEGTGVLSYPIKKDASFEAIGVTLEPDANGTRPRGKKVLGS